VESPLELGDPAALKEIAARVLGNVRRLQGAMTRVAAFSSMLSEPVTPSLAHRALDSSPSGDSPRASRTESPVADSPSVDAIQEAICSVRGVSRQDLLSAKRTSRISHARQLAMYLTRQETSLSLAQIAREFNRDHSTVLHAIRTVSTRLGPESETAATLHRTCELLAVSPNARSPQATPIHQAISRPQTPSTSALPGASP
jgi:chromosomal replication initiator protein